MLLSLWQSHCVLCDFHRELLGREEHWPILLSTTCIPAIVQLIILPWFPESPRYLFIDRKDEDGCKKGKSEELLIVLYIFDLKQGGHSGAESGVFWHSGFQHMITLRCSVGMFSFKRKSLTQRNCVNPAA